MKLEVFTANADVARNLAWLADARKRARLSARDAPDEALNTARRVAEAVCTFVIESNGGDAPSQEERGLENLIQLVTRTCSVPGTIVQHLKDIRTWGNRGSHFQIDPQHRVGEADAVSLLGKVDLVCAWYEQTCAVASQGESPSAHPLLPDHGSGLLSLSQFSALAAEMEGKRSTRGDDSYARLVHALALEEAGESRGAVAEYQRLIHAARAAHEIDIAIVFARRVVRLEPEAPQHLVELAELYAADGRARDAGTAFLAALRFHALPERDDQYIQVAERFLKVCRGDTRTRSSLAAAYARRGDWARVYRTLENVNLARLDAHTTITLADATARLGLRVDALRSPIKTNRSTLPWS